jgi:hypothetical protein
MATAWRSKWLDWQPGDEIMSVPTETDVTKLTKPHSVGSVSSTSEKFQIISAPADDPEAWRKSFRTWVKSACVRHARSFGGIGCLHVHFAEWAITHDAVPCTRDTFEVLLSDAGFLFCDGMVSGLILHEDYEAARL